MGGGSTWPAESDGRGGEGEGDEAVVSDDEAGGIIGSIFAAAWVVLVVGDELASPINITLLV